MVSLASLLWDGFIKQYQQPEDPKIFTMPCAYFDGVESNPEFYLFPAEEYIRRVFPAPLATKFPAQQVLYYHLLAAGFRRTGSIYYRNFCTGCGKCRPIRIPVSAYCFNKRERHILAKNSDITVNVNTDAATFVTDEKIELYRRYQKKHDTDLSFEDARNGLANSNGLSDEFNGYTPREKPVYSGTANIDYYLGDRLVGVSVADFCGTGALSSNYFYYDISPDILKRSLGTFSILYEIALCQKKNTDYYYLGYWISGHPKMDYKANFKPHELFTGFDCDCPRWERVDRAGNKTAV